MDAPVSVFDYPAQEPVIQATDTWYLPRSRYIPLLLLFPTALCGLSWLAGGVPAITDFGLIALTFVCAALVLRELIVFPRRFGLGGLVLFGGYIVFFCYDYIIHWMGVPFGDLAYPLTKEVVAKAAFYHCAFAVCAAAGLTLTTPRRVPALLARLPEANTPGIYLIVVMLGFVMGIAPYFLFTRQNGFEAIYLSIFSGRSSIGPEWTIGRTGNVNYNWGGYIVHVLQIGQVAAQFGAFYALMITRNWITRLICWSIWGLHLAIAFGGGSRGEVTFMALPVCGFLFLKYQMQAAALLRSLSLRAYILSGAVLLVVMFLCQMQIRFRNVGFVDVRLEEVNLGEFEGTSMFTEGLLGWALIPDHYPFIQNRFPGEALVGPVPETAWRFVLHGIPRALWPTKPIDPLNQWYNSIKTGRDVSNTEGTTISTGLVGEWYFRYGSLGVIEGAFLFAWLCRVFEQSVVLTARRPFGLLMSIALGVCLLRFYRNFTPQLVYTILIPGVALAMLIWFFNMF
ncbi:MAG: hypothetical protein ABSH20_24495, partial [Tepidisphaeraceae bacterium]